MVARRAKAVAPEQLEEFETAFRAFDKEGVNRLDLDQLSGALSSLGVGEVVSPPGGIALALCGFSAFGLLIRCVARRRTCSTCGKMRKGSSPLRSTSVSW